MMVCGFFRIPCVRFSSNALLALTWFKDHFVKCNGRAALVKTWLPAPQDGPKSWLDQLVYDRALMLVRLRFCIPKIICF